MGKFLAMLGAIIQVSLNRFIAGSNSSTDINFAPLHCVGDWCFSKTDLHSSGVNTLRVLWGRYTGRACRN